jgi:hypothetical protein
MGLSRSRPITKTNHFPQGALQPCSGLRLQKIPLTDQ